MKSFVLITGASSGIGKSCATLLAAQGKNLILLARRKERLESIQQDLQSKFGGTVLVFAVDVCSDSQVLDCFEQIKKHNIEAVINNAGLARGRAKFQESDWSDLTEMIQTNVSAFTFVAHQAVPLLIKSKGHLINISSIAAREPYSGGHVYCGTKSFVKTFSKALRKDLLGTGVRVTEVAPGAVETEFSVVRFHGDVEAAQKVYEKFSVLSPDDIAEAVVFALNAPKKVNVEQMVVYATDQASPVEVHRGD